MRSDARKRTQPTPAAQPEVELSEETLRRVSDFLVAWRGRTGNDHEIIYDLDGGLGFGGTSLRWSDLRALVEQVEAGRAAGAAEALESAAKEIGSACKASVRWLEARAAALRAESGTGEGSQTDG